jgi:8-oxo-dGTP pyrophosphatase MutT (NUDIX family)
MPRSLIPKLTPLSKLALARLRAYQPPPFPTWDLLPVSRRAAVLLLLFSDRRGNLRIVITMRAASLRNYSGHAALPGGKADDLQEEPFHIARREAYEEIGLPMDDGKLPKGFRIEHLCMMPCNLAKTQLAVRPCVAFLHSEGPGGEEGPSVEETMIPRLDAKEVAAVFSAPFHNFLKAEDEVVPGETVPGERSDWYDGHWLDWHGEGWRLHNFYVPVNNQQVTKPRVREGGQKAIAEELEEEEEQVQRYKVWGMTARILVDAAWAAYGEEPEFPVSGSLCLGCDSSKVMSFRTWLTTHQHNKHHGDEHIMEMLYKQGLLGEKKKSEAAQEGERLEANKLIAEARAKQKQNGEGTL